MRLRAPVTEADILVEILVRSQAGGRVLGNAARALAGEIVDHPAPGLVIVVELIDGGDPEGHGRKERQTRGQHAENDKLSQGHPDEQCREYHYKKQEEPGSLGSKQTRSPCRSLVKMWLA